MPNLTDFYRVLLSLIEFYRVIPSFGGRCRRAGIREEELASLKGRKYLDALCVYFWATTPVLVAVLTFATYVLMGGTLTAAKVHPLLPTFT